MSSKIFGIQRGQLVPSYKYTLKRSLEGRWTGSHTFRCFNDDYDSVTIKEKLEQDTPITTLDPSIPLTFNFVKLEDHTIEGVKGNITTIRCNFSGYSATDGFGSGINESGTTTSFNGVTSQGRIIDHPNYLAEVTSSQARVAIAAYWSNQARLHKDGSAYYILRITDDDDYGAGQITDPAEIKWIDKIAAGTKFYDKPQIEWTVTQANEGGMTSSDLNKFGRKVTPPYNPPEPSWATGDVGWWHFSSVTEDKTDNSSTYSRTYTLRDDVLDPDIYDYTL